MIRGHQCLLQLFSVDPFSNRNLPNVVSRLGLGFKRSVKPDILFPGGRVRLKMSRTGTLPTIASPDVGGQGIGVKAATIKVSGQNDQVGYVIGTNPATALATRAAHRLLDALLEASEANGWEIDQRDLGLIAKALLVHSASWVEEGSEPLENVIAEAYGYSGRQWAARRDDTARFLGFGVCDVERVIACTQQRATIVGVHEIRKNQTVVFELPLPSCQQCPENWCRSLQRQCELCKPSIPFKSNQVN